jgi:hypothetical protein
MKSKSYLGHNLSYEECKRTVLIRLKDIMNELSKIKKKCNDYVTEPLTVEESNEVEAETEMDANALLEAIFNTREPQKLADDYYKVKCIGDIEEIEETYAKLIDEHFKETTE